MYTCPNKNLPEWKELEKTIPDRKYTVWDQNNGNGIDKAPNKEPSKLFTDLLIHFGGNRVLAINAKAEIFSDGFKKAFGDWLNPVGDNMKGKLDENGEPLFSEAQKLLTKNLDKARYSYQENLKEIEDMLESTEEEHQLVKELKKLNNTSDAIQLLLDNPDVHPNTKILLKLLQKHSTGLSIHKKVSKVTGSYNSEEKHIKLFLDRKTADNVQGVAETLAHELLHHYLLDLYETNSDFKTKVDEYQKKTVDLFGKDRHGWYGIDDADDGSLISGDEFLNEVISNVRFRKEIIRRNSSLWDMIKALFIKLFTGKVTKLRNQELADFTNYIGNIIEQVNQQDDTLNHGIADITPSEQSANVRQKIDKSTLFSSRTDKLYTDIKKGIVNRINSISRYKNKNLKMINELNKLVQELASLDAEQGMLSFIDHVGYSVGEAQVFVNKPYDSISEKQVRQLQKDYVGFYLPLLQRIKDLMDTADLFKEHPDYYSIRDNIELMLAKMETVNNKLNHISKSKAYDIFIDFCRENGMPEEIIQETIDWLEDPTTDSYVFMRAFGMASNSNNAVLQTIAKMLNDTKNLTERQTLSVGNNLTKILKAAQAKYGVDVQKLLYEKSPDGNYTGYMVQNLNYGFFKQNYNKFVSELAAKLGIEKNEDGKYELPDDPDIRDKWFKELNKWYSKHATRRFKPEYYELRNSILSEDTRSVLDNINMRIMIITDAITEDGIVYNNRLSPAEYEELKKLQREKYLVQSLYNLDGTEKTGDELRMAQEIQKFNDKIKDRVKYKPDKVRFEEDRKKVEKKYGLNSPQYKLWMNRNQAERFTEEFWKDLEKAMENSQSQSPLYDKLVERRRQILKVYKEQETGTVDVDKLSDKERQQLLELDKDAADAYVIPSKNEKEQVDEDTLRFSDVASIEPTDQYYRDMSAAQASGSERYNVWLFENHYEDAYGFLKPASYYTKLVPVDNGKKYKEIVPIGRYNEVDVENSDLADPNFDKNGPSIQPNKALYDNSKAYNEVMSKPEVKALYEEINKVMDQANSYISFVASVNDKRMPQIPARLLQVLNRKGSLRDKLKYVVEDFATTKDDDLDFVREYKTMPNGDPIKVIPTRYIRMLENPNNIATDAVSSVIHYFQMAANFHNMQNQQNEIELLLNLLKGVEVKGRKFSPKGSSNVYKQAELLVDRLLYGRNKVPIKFNIGNKEINVSKMLDIIRSYITKVNLSYNIWSMGTSILTDVTFTTLDSFVGRYFDSKDLRFASNEYAKHLPEILANVGNPVPNNKITHLIALNSIVKDSGEIYDRLDQSPVLRALNQHFWFAGYTQGDFVVKSHTLLAIYHSLRYVDGVGFMYKEEYIQKYFPNNRKLGSAHFNQLSTTLYDAYTVNKDGNLVVKSEYEQYVTDKLINLVKNRVQILTKRVDGTIRDVDKSYIHAHSLMSFIIMHRNFMINGLHERFKVRQFNMDTGLMEEGIYRGMYRFIGNLIKDKHFTLSTMLADYDNMAEYEQYAVRKTLADFMLAVSSTVVALTIAALVDGDDDYNNWLMQSVAYLAMRSAFEFRAMFNFEELMGMIKSPTAAFTTFENAFSFVNIFMPTSYIGKKTPFSKVKKGNYEGMPYFMKNIIKTTPLKNIIEAKDPKLKRNYLENQLMTNF